MGHFKRLIESLENIKDRLLFLDHSSVRICYFLHWLTAVLGWEEEDSSL